jgi:pimeloyl-ACP methyl ester carboxylesterase
MSGVRRRWVQSDTVRLAVYERGPSSAPTLVLVHGYPDNSSVWDGVAERLAERFHVVTYDVRGHGESEEPAGGGYRIDELAADLLAVTRAVTDQPVHLVGHDWGSIQAWAALENVRSFTSVSGPDLGHISHWLRGWPRRPRAAARQAAHSWYIGVFQLPVLPELIWRNRTLLRKFEATYRDARNGLRLYRDNMGRGRHPARQIHVPVQQVALTSDPYVTLPLLKAAEPWCDNLYRRKLVAGHWAPRTHPDHLARMITDFVDHVDGAEAPRELRRAGQQPIDNQLALVTGAGSGTGRATALALARHGAQVLCADTDFEAAARTAQDVAGSAYHLDHTDSTATARLAEHIGDEHGVPDLLIADVEDWRSAIHTLRSFLPPMVERREGGHVVITSPAPIKRLARELRPAGIRVTAIGERGHGPEKVAAITIDCIHAHVTI